MKKILLTLALLVGFVGVCLPDAQGPDVTFNHHSVTMYKWNREARLTVTYISGIGEFNAYTLPRSERMRDGGVEVEIILSERPATNVFEFQLEDDEQLDYLYQAPLDKVNYPGRTCTALECRDASGVRNKRPIDIIDSYAIYHKTKANHVVGQMNYETGKFQHLYRSESRDRDGAKAWNSMWITDGVLRITVPWRFLDDATYPIIVDPTFGYTSQGASTDNAGNQLIFGEATGTPASNGVLNSITAFVCTNGVGDSTLNPALYNNSAGNPTTLVTGTAINSGGSSITSASCATQVTTTYGTPPAITSGTQYHFGLSAQYANDYRWAHDSGNNLAFGNDNIHNWPADVSMGYTYGFDEKVSVFGTYTTSIISFESVYNSGYQATASSYNITSVDCTGSNTALYVGVSMLSVGGSSVTSITHNGDNLTLLGAVASVSGAIRSELWRRISPDTGAQTVAITLSTGLISASGALCLSGVNQTVPEEGTATATATNVGAADATVNVVSVADNDWFVGVVATDDTAITPSLTSRWNVTGAGGSGSGETTGPKSPAGTQAVGWTGVAGLATWSVVGTAVRDTAASTGGVHGLTTLGAGN